MFFDCGRTIMESPEPPSITIDLKTDLQRRLNRFLWTAFPYFLETINPREGPPLAACLNDKSPKDRDFDVFIICEKQDEERE